MPSVIYYAWSALMFLVGTVGALVWLTKLWRSDKQGYGKLEESLQVVAAMLAFWAGAGYGVLEAWASKYPPKELPQGRASFYLELIYIPVLLAALSFAASWWMKKRRVRIADTDEDRVWAALYAEYGWAEARRLYESYLRRQDPRDS